MKLTVTELKALLHGAIRTEQTPDGYLALYRFTEKQRAYYQSTNETKLRALFFEKSLASSNIRLTFQTNSPFFSFDFRTKKASSRKYYYFDVFVDGMLTVHQGEEDVLEGAGNLQVSLPEGEHLVSVYCPVLFSTEIANFTLADGATLSPVTLPRRILMLGDSITQGYDARFSSGSYANLLTDMLHATSVNQGIGGEVFNPDMLDSDLGFAPDLITVAYGTNDFSKCTKEDMRAAANEFYRRLRATYPGVKIFSILPIWRIDCTKAYDMRFEEAKQIARAAAEAVGAIVIDGTTLVPHMREFFADTKVLHPNELGFRFYTSALYAAMKPHLDEV